MSEAKKCLVPTCKNNAKTRGLCATCYSTVIRLVKQGAIKWEDLEAAGRCTPKGKGSRSRGPKAQWLLTGEA